MRRELNEKGSISGYIKGDTNATMAGWKVCLDKDNNGACEENKEPFTITDNKGYYKFTNLEKGNYSIIQVPHQNWNIIKPNTNKYDIYINYGQNYRDLNFENTFTKGKSK